VGGIVHLIKHQLPQAFVEVNSARALNPDSTGPTATLAAAYALSGNRAEAEKLLTELMNRRAKQ
jgi:hypothetical protein